MSNIEKWTLLLGEKRFREKSTLSESDRRNSFDRDYAKLIFSAPIRRLQGKTQVFPLPTDDYPRTRLTHSLEVSFLGSSLGASIESKLLNRGDIPKDYAGNLPSLLRVAGLIHDLGNTPFGHFGEAAIRDFFTSFFKQGHMDLTDAQIADLVNFDGNVQTFRILTKLHYFGDVLSYNLSYQTLSTIVKYPSDSLQGNHGDESEVISNKKFGFFQSEKEEYRRISEFLGIGGSRNPITFLLEAADDIAYRSADIEDSIKQRVISLEEMMSLLLSNMSEEHQRQYEYEYEKLLRENQSIKEYNGFHDYIVAQKLRVFTQQLMIGAVINSFMRYYNSIMQGTFQEELLEVSSVCDINEAFKKLFKRVLRDREINRLEIAGYKAINGLLSLFVPAALDKGGKKGSFSHHVFAMISDEYRHLNSLTPQSSYDMLQLVVDYVSGMTDDFAIDLYQRLSGIKI